MCIYKEGSEVEKKNTRVLINYEASSSPSLMSLSKYIDRKVHVRHEKSAGASFILEFAAVLWILDALTIRSACCLIFQ